MRTPRNLPCLALCLFTLAVVLNSTTSQGQAAAPEMPPPPPHAKQIHLKHVLVIGQTKGFEHDSVSAAMAAIYNMGQESGLWDTEMRTDTELLTKKDLGRNAKNLSYFDVLIFASTTGELDMDDSQKADMLSFIHDDGKGFVGIHAAHGHQLQVARVRRDDWRLVRSASVDDFQRADHQ